MKLRVLENKVIPVVIVSILTFVTISTSVMAASKILGSFGRGAMSDSKFSDKNQAIQDKDKKEGDLKEGAKSKSAAGGSPQKTGTQKTVGTTLKTSAKPTNIIAQNNIPTPTSNNVNSNTSKCIVTIFGKQYDVTSLMNTHSGGNVFNCGTDMSATYQGRHGTNVSLIAPYLVASSGGGPAGTPSQTGATGSTQNNGNIIPTSNPTSNPTSSPIRNSTNCIVTIFGKQYDVTSLMNTHSGGNVFNCGTDMSATYQGRHGTNVSLIAPYLVASSGGGPAGTPSQTGIISNPPIIQPTVTSPIRRTRGDDDDDDEGGD